MGSESGCIDVLRVLTNFCPLAILVTRASDSWMIGHRFIGFTIIGHRFKQQSAEAEQSWQIERIVRKPKGGPIIISIASFARFGRYQNPCAMLTRFAHGLLFQYINRVRTVSFQIQIYVFFYWSKVRILHPSRHVVYTVPMLKDWTVCKPSTLFSNPSEHSKGSQKGQRSENPSIKIDCSHYKKYTLFIFLATKCRRVINRIKFLSKSIYVLSICLSFSLSLSPFRSESN